MHFLDLLIALAAGALIGILVGRRASLDRLRCQELEAELARVRDGATRYREDVAEHFTKTSELVKGLTLQYRSVYDHLAEGARTLCPERVIELSQGDSASAFLGSGGEAADEEAGAEVRGEIAPTPPTAH
ncbi:Inner membrane protein YhcB [Myxococcaceae bacterium]|jgi:uncharacterized membrane-anchored protein YhcB (DUF1043 family)|nr:Inner membrane protein YhcB [Myxococcaceae bacterium]